mmetsp:Transcript_115306/g.326714  ORF Transcript_115306/g.326714 Transcript_115306/m.326714 type:complete len:262 (-) Transcript_115306:12-797(-)
MSVSQLRTKTLWASICKQKSSSSAPAPRRRRCCARAKTGPAASLASMRKTRTRRAGSHAARDSGVNRACPHSSSSSCRRCRSLRCAYVSRSWRGVPRRAQNFTRTSPSPAALCCTTPTRTREGLAAREKADSRVASRRDSRSAAMRTMTVAPSRTAGSVRFCTGGKGRGPPASANGAGMRRHLPPSSTMSGSCHDTGAPSLLAFLRRWPMPCTGLCAESSWHTHNNKDVRMVSFRRWRYGEWSYRESVGGSGEFRPMTFGP